MNFNNNVDLGYSVYQFDELLDVYTYDINSESISYDNSDRRNDIFANQENNLYLKLIKYHNIIESFRMKHMDLRMMRWNIYGIMELILKEKFIKLP